MKSIEKLEWMRANSASVRIETNQFWTPTWLVEATLRHPDNGDTHTVRSEGEDLDDLIESVWMRFSVFVGTNPVWVREPDLEEIFNREFD